MFVVLAASAQYTEGFEAGYTDGATSFTAPGGETLNLSSDFRIYNFATFGANSSDWFIDTGFQEGNTNTPPSEIFLANAGKSFLLYSFYCWTSDDDGGTDVSGTITLTATGPGGTASQDFLVSPTGSSGADWHQLTTAGTALDGFEIQSLAMTYDAPINYVALDDIEYEVMEIVGVEEHLWAQDLRIYPVPVKDELNIDLQGVDAPLQYRLYNVVGAELASGTLTGPNTSTLDVSALKKGVYFIELNKGRQVLSRRFAKL